MIRIAIIVCLAVLFVILFCGCDVGVHHTHDPQKVDINVHHDPQKIQIERPRLKDRWRPAPHQETLQ